VCVDGKERVVLGATQLGSAVVASALSPDEGLSVFAELQKARRCFVLENELHTIYLVSRVSAEHDYTPGYRRLCIRGRCRQSINVGCSFL